MKDYKFFMNFLMESEIIVDKPKIEYIHMLDIEKDFQSGKYFKALMHLSCLIESNLYQLLLKKLPESPKNFKANQIKRMQNLSLKLLIDWASGEPIPKNKNLVCYPCKWDVPPINDEEKLILNNLKEIRNDIAHVSFLTYDENLRKEIVKKIIDDVAPVHNKLIKEIIKITNEKSKPKNTSQ